MGNDTIQLKRIVGQDLDVAVAAVSGFTYKSLQLDSPQLLPSVCFLPFSCSFNSTRLCEFRFNLFFLCLMAVLMVKREQAGLLSNNALSWLPINSIFQPAEVYLKTQKERLDLPD